jgi:hypothetical protein
VQNTCSQPNSSSPVRKHGILERKPNSGAAKQTTDRHVHVAVKQVGPMSLFPRAKNSFPVGYKGQETLPGGIF